MESDNVKGNFKRLGVLALILTLVMSLAACSFGKQTSEDGVHKSKKSEVNTTVKTDADKTVQLKKEKVISDGQVYVQNNRVIATMIIKSGVSDKEAKDLAQKYGQDLKKKYKNMEVRVMAVRDNKNIVNLTVK